MENIRRIQQALQLLHQAARDTLIDDLDHRADFLGAIEFASTYAHKALSELNKLQQLQPSREYGSLASPSIGGGWDQDRLARSGHTRSPSEDDVMLRQLAELEDMYRCQRDRSQSPLHRAPIRSENRRDRSPIRRRGYEDLRQEYESSVNDVSDVVNSLMKRSQRLSPRSLLADRSRPTRLEAETLKPPPAPAGTMETGAPSRPSEQVLYRRNRTTQPHTAPRTGILGAVMNRLRPMAPSIFGSSPPASVIGGGSKHAATSSLSDFDLGRGVQGRKTMQPPSILSKISASSSQAGEGKRDVPPSVSELRYEREKLMSELMQAPPKRGRSPAPSFGYGLDDYGQPSSKRMKPTLPALPTHMLQEMKKQREVILQGYLASKGDQNPSRRISGLPLSRTDDDHAMKRTVPQTVADRNWRRDLGDRRGEYEELEKELLQVDPRNPSSAMEMRRIEKAFQFFDKYEPRNPLPGKFHELNEEFQQLDPRTTSMSELDRFEAEFRELDEAEAAFERERKNNRVQNLLGKSREQSGGLGLSRHVTREVGAAREQEQYDYKDSGFSNDRMVTRPPSKYDPGKLKDLSPPAQPVPGHKRKAVPMLDEILVDDDAKSFRSKQSSLPQEDLQAPASALEAEQQQHPLRTSHRIHELSDLPDGTEAKQPAEIHGPPRKGGARMKKPHGNKLTTNALQQLDRIVELEAGGDGSGYGSEDESDKSSELAAWLGVQEEKERLKALEEADDAGGSEGGKSFEPEY